MVDMMERVVNELMPQPMVPPAAVPVIAAEMKPAEMKPAEVKPVEMKPAEVKPAEMKPAEVKPAEVKPAEVKPSAPEAAGNKSHIEGSARPPPPLPDVAIDIKLEPLDGPELPALFPIPRIVPAVSRET
ncbi:hypothetical protein V5799_033659 [Amblyomma americanum]|uniref:Uncharacterized protein n=1 Tax=Amblyomma americanum TaxID=6943 RepID=A0AAQ4DMP0_AMBAM